MEDQSEITGETHLYGRNSIQSGCAGSPLYRCGRQTAWREQRKGVLLLFQGSNVFCPWIKIIERLLDRIDYPQSSVKIRSFQEKEEKRLLKPEKVLEGREVANHSGKLDTFLVHIKYRQNATWQGEIRWVEKGKNVSFRSELELLKLMDNALEM